MFNNKRFRGEIDGVNTRYFLDQLDNSLGQVDRVKLVKDILYEKNELGNIHLNEYFEKVFEQKDMTENGDTSNIKLCLNKSDGLSDNDYVCRSLERMADYMLYSPDGERITKKTKYNFYPKGIFEDRVLKKEKNLEELVERSSSKSGVEGDCSDDIIDFLIRAGNNYKKSIQQKIYSKDLVEYNILRDYENSIVKLKGELKMNIQDKRKRKEIGNVIFGMKNDQLLAKDFIKGTIYFKQVLADTTCIDYDMLDFGNKDHVLALLKFSPSNCYDFDDDLNCVMYDLENLLDKIRLTKIESEVLELWRIEAETQKNIADELGFKQQYVNQVLDSIVKKITTKYNELYEDFYYLNIEKGEYKKCSKCGEIKLVSKFRKRSDTKGDGHRKECKECEVNLKNVAKNTCKTV